MANDNGRHFRLIQHFTEGSGLVVYQFRQAFCACADIVVIIFKVCLLADHPDFHIRMEPMLALPGVEHSRFQPWVGAHKQNRICLFNALKSWVEDIARATIFRIKRRAILAAVHVFNAVLAKKRLQGKHVFHRREITGNGANLFGISAFERLGDSSKSLVPTGRGQLAALFHIRLIKTLRFKPIKNEARLVGNPLFVDGVIHPRHNAHHFAHAAIHPNGRAQRIHYVNALSLGQFPRPRLEGVRLGGERANRAKVDHIALELRGHSAFKIGGDFRIFPAANKTEF